jgi:hypothetical protein
MTERATGDLLRSGKRYCDDTEQSPTPLKEPSVQITHIDHVGIAVADLDAAIEMYETSFGMRCVHTEVNEEQGVREAMLAVGDSGSYLPQERRRRPGRAGRARTGGHGPLEAARPGEEGHPASRAKRSANPPTQECS